MMWTANLFRTVVEIGGEKPGKLQGVGPRPIFRGL